MKKYGKIIFLFLVFCTLAIIFTGCASGKIPEEEPQPMSQAFTLKGLEEPITPDKANQAEETAAPEETATVEYTDSDGETTVRASRAQGETTSAVQTKSEETLNEEITENTASVTEKTVTAASGTSRESAGKSQEKTTVGLTGTTVPPKTAAKSTARNSEQKTTAAKTTAKPDNKDTTAAKTTAKSDSKDTTKSNSTAKSDTKATTTEKTTEKSDSKTTTATKAAEKSDSKTTTTEKTTAKPDSKDTTTTKATTKPDTKETTANKNPVKRERPESNVVFEYQSYYEYKGNYVSIDNFTHNENDYTVNANWFVDFHVIRKGNESNNMRIEYTAYDADGNVIRHSYMLAKLDDARAGDTVERIRMDFPYDAVKVVITNVELISNQ